MAPTTPMDTKRADLHTHTHYSDGTQSPRQVLELAKQAGLSAIAITDHDTFDSFPESREAAAEFGLELIPGIEMSASHAGVEVHVLGLFVDVEHRPLLDFLATQKIRREQRMHEMVAKLQAIGLAVTIENVLAIGGKGTLGRPHVAQALVRRGHVKSNQEAFEKYLGNNGPAFVQGSPLSPKTVIELIRQAGGIAVLAHPIYLRDDQLIDLFCRDGLLGLEVYHSSHTPDEVRRYEQIADRLGLLRTGGSDYHGNAKEGAAIGTGSVPYALVERLREWKDAHAARR